MGDLRLEVGGQVDYVDRIKWTFFRADAAADAEAFANEGNLAVGRDFDAEFACADYRAGLFAFL